MNLIDIDPRLIVFDDNRPVDEAVVEAIREEGLYDDPRGPSEVRDMIAVRRQHGGTYRVVKGADELRAVLALLNRNADCYDPVGKQTVPASELYNTVRVVVFD